MSIKIRKDYRIEKVVSPDSTRPVIRHAWIKDNKMMGTDGRCAAIVPVVRDENAKDSDGFVSKRILELARKGKIDHKEGDDKRFGHPIKLQKRAQRVKDTIILRPKPERFPHEDVERMMSPYGPAFFEIGIDARLLLDVAEAMGSGEERQGIVLTFHGATKDDAALYAIQLRPLDTKNEARGIIMPMRAPLNP